jgi:O-antigen ligase
VALVLRLAGPGVQKEFLSSFKSKDNLDASAITREKHWSACIESMTRRPLGVGPDHWPLVAPEYGLPAMEAHTTWLQLGAELGVQGLACIMLFYGLCFVRLWGVTREKTPVPDPWMRHLARMVIASLVGFVVSAQFVSVEGIELPYYVVLIGGGVLKLKDGSPVPSGRAEGQPTITSNPRRASVTSSS